MIHLVLDRPRLKPAAPAPRKIGFGPRPCRYHDTLCALYVRGDMRQAQATLTSNRPPSRLLDAWVDQADQPMRCSCRRVAGNIHYCYLDRFAYLAGRQPDAAGMSPHGVKEILEHRHGGRQGHGLTPPLEHRVRIDQHAPYHG